MKNKTVNLAIVILVLTMVFSGCKKGQDDPFFSFRSRNARIAGEWVIRTFSKTTTVQEQTNTVNSINDERNNIVSNTTIDTTISANQMTVETSTSSKTTATDISYELGDTSYVFVTENNITDSESHFIKKFNMAVDLEIKDDGTWHASITQTHVSTVGMSITLKNGIDTLFFNEIDTIFIPQSTVSWTEEGTWNWLDSDKSKVIIQAGPMAGNIIRLANDEVIIDDTKTSTENSTVNTVEDFRTFDDVQDPFKMEEGVGTSTYNRTTTTVTKQEWEPK